MKSPMYLLSQYIFGPLTKYINFDIPQRACGKFANFLFSHVGKETALLMLAANAATMISSHIAQIGGLKRSKRENKDYLINQEKQELMLDTVLSVIPPFLLNNFIKKKLESGAITTKSMYKQMTEELPQFFNLDIHDVYSAEHIRPVRETIINSLHELIEQMLIKHKNMPTVLNETLRGVNETIEGTKDFSNYGILKSPLTGIEKHLSKHFVGPGKLYPPSLENITTDIDDLIKTNKIPDDILKKMGYRNGKAYDELSGMINGLLVLSAIIYSITVSNIIVPILKNKLANRNYIKELAKKGETKESIKRKKRFAYNDTPIITTSASSPFSNYYTKQEQTTITSSPQKGEKTLINKSNPFNSFDSYYNISPQSGRLRI